MKILIDGDACPSCSLRETERIAKQYGIPCHIYCSSSRNMESRYSEVHFTDSCKEAADFAITNAAADGDVVVTSDGGLAAMALSRQARVLNPFGGEYTEQNIMLVLYNRSLSAKKQGKGTRRRRTGGNVLSHDKKYGDLLMEAIFRS